MPIYDEHVELEQIAKASGFGDRIDGGRLGNRKASSQVALKAARAHKKHKIWTSERVHRLRALAAQNLTAAQIALLMKTSRAAVCGAVFRFGITLALGTAERKPRPNKEGPRVAVKTKPQEVKEIPDRRPQPFIVREAKGVKPRLIPLAQLREGDCRWPYGDTAFRFCGCPVRPGKAYCSGHAALSVRAA